MWYNAVMDTCFDKVYDCIVIGGGVIGTFAARELCKFRGKFLLIESGNDVAVGTSKANSGIVHAGFDAAPCTLKAKFNVAGSRIMRKKCAELDVPYKQNGALVLSFGGSRGVNALRRRAVENGVDAEIVTAEFARALEPNLSDKVVSALYAPTSAIVSPYELDTACYENFTANGGEVRLNSAVTGIERVGKLYRITAGGGALLTHTVINAAGLYADVINNLVCSVKRKIIARRGQYVLLDKMAAPVTRTVFQIPTARGKGVLVAPTCHGNTLVGPSAEDVNDKSDVSTTAEILNDVFDKGRLSVPCLHKRDIITQFSGLRAVCGDDFVIEESEDGFFNALGICSPGLASSPAIGEYLAEKVAVKLRLCENEKFDPSRRAITCFASATDDEREKLIAENPRYGNIVCRCECVTEAEIVQAIERGAVDLDGVKRRVRAGMGRCQAGFCTPALIKILARELGVDEEKITKNGTGAIVSGRLS